MIKKQYDELNVEILSTREEMGRKAAQDVIEKIRTLLETKSEISIIFAAAPSQNDFFNHLISAEKIDWNKVNVFHMDEYIGLEKSHPSAFSNFLKEKVFKHLSLKSVNYINGLGNSKEECDRYSSLLNKKDIDIVIMGIGENGHIAFNDPSVADFKDPYDVKIVALDEVSRNQQVNDGCFPGIDYVPTHAITLTIPRLLRVDYVFCIVPTDRKAEAVSTALLGPITDDCPASILRTKTNSKLYLDTESARLLEGRNERK